MKLALILAAALLAPLAPAARAQGAGAVPPSGATTKAPPKKAPAKRRKKTAAAKPKKKAPESRYKSTALSQSVDEHYLFDEDGNPIDKKKAAAKPKAKAPSSDEDDDKSSCSSGLSCSDDADAL